ncbi:amidohydrolase family protein [Candidatus Pacearchaeota archaeon]|nr:amidohydrolase family protein [Candidatus Pacearchaeota archaeon]
MIIDGHAHMITASIMKALSVDENTKKRLQHEWTDNSIDKHKETWIEAMDKWNIEKTVFMANSSLNKEFTDFINTSERFIGCAKVNPEESDAVLHLEKEYENGMRGVKIYATGDGCDVGAKECYPVYEFCARKKLPIIIHFGVTIGHKSNLFEGNPLRLSSPLKEFPDVNFIIAHFGAGFFRETLMLKYKQDNLYVDTSGTNNWTDYQDSFLTLKDVFKKSIEIFSSEGIIFGTDTRIFPHGYREHILKQQRGILDELKTEMNLSELDIENIMYNNAKRVFRL